MTATTAQERFRLIALHEAPSARAFTMAAMVVHEEGADHVCIISPTECLPPRKIDLPQFRIMGGQMLTFEHAPKTFECLPMPDMAAGWVGSKFLEDCGRVAGLAWPDLPDANDIIAVPSEDKPPGWFWIERPVFITGRRERWHRRAAEVACERQSAEIAGMLLWCLPYHLETLAATWYTAPDDAAKAEAIKWPLSRLQINEPDLTEELLVARFEESVRQVLGRLRHQ